MGCLCDKIKATKCELNGGDNNKGYSWDQRKLNLDLKDFIIENIEDNEEWKLPNSINGQQFVVRNCSNGTIYLLDHINTLTIDDCNDCRFIIGPVKGSVFMRNCKNCAILVACGQFRMRDCNSVNVFLCCPTQPIIESSRLIHFGCYQLNYNQLEGQFKAAGLSVFNNNWNIVHDFTPSHGDRNWCILPSTMSVTDYLRQPQQVCDSLNISLKKEHSLVPLTSGIYPIQSDDVEICLVVFFSHPNHEVTAKFFIETLLVDRPQCWLVSCRQLVLEPKGAEMVFGTSLYNQNAQDGPMIGLVWAGPRIIYSCEKAIEKVVGEHSRIFITRNPQTASIHAETFTSISSLLALN